MLPVLVIFAIFMLFSAASASAQWRPAPSLELGSAVRPQALALGDFDSDGRQDIVVADFAGDAVQVRLGNGDGTFRGEHTVAITKYAEDLAIADFTADGNEDLAVAATVSGSAEGTFRRGVGDGKFSVGSTGFNLPGAGHSLAFGDFNNDGWTDLAAAAAQHAAVRLGIGGGADGAGDIAVGGPARSIATGDFDGDGNGDLAVLHGGDTPRLVVLPGKGTGAFADAKALPLANPGSDLAVGDFDGDAREDVVVAVADKDRLVVRMGNGDGTLRDGLPDVTVGGKPQSVVVADVDADGREDLLTADVADDTVSVRLGNGNGTFRDGGEIPTGDMPVDLAVGDLNADGRQDVAVADHKAGTVSVRLGAGAAPLDGNLLVNGGFEQGLGARTPVQSPNIPGWTTIGGMTFVRYGVNPLFSYPTWIEAPRYGGGRHVLWGGDSTGFGGVTQATQTAIVTEAAEAIDAGRADVTLSAYLGGGLVFPDTMTATAEFLDGDGEPLGVLNVGPVTKEERRSVTTLLPRAGSAAVPRGTRRIRVTLTSIDTDRYSSAIADNVKLTLTTRPAPADPPPAGAPAFGAGTGVSLRLAARRAPLRVRVVNANAFPVTGSLRGRRFTVTATGRATIRLPLSKAQRRRLRRARKLPLRLTAAVIDPAGNRRTITRRVRLVAARRVS
jgi:hypothetical protein